MGEEPSPSIDVSINKNNFRFLIDTGASCNLIYMSTWKKIGRCHTTASTTVLSASNDINSTSGTVKLMVITSDNQIKSMVLSFTVTNTLHILTVKTHEQL